MNEVTKEQEVEMKQAIQIKGGNIEEVNELFKYPQEYTKSVMKGFHNAFILLGGQGQGKTTAVLKTLQEEKAKYIYHSGVSTPFALYQFLYEHRENEIIVFDDCVGLINNTNALSILLSALWSPSDTRVVCWNTTKDSKISIPTKFIFNSRIIIITNKMPKTYYSQVVLSRCLNLDLKLSYNQLLNLMYCIGNKEVVDFIAENSSCATRGFDLRLLRKAENFKKFDENNWKFLIMPMLEDIDERIQLIIQGCGDKEWIDKTGTNLKQKQRLRAELGLTRGYHKCLNTPIGHLDAPTYLYKEEKGVIL